MPDQLTSPGPSAPAGTGAPTTVRHGLRPALLRAGAVLMLFVVVGAGLGVLWEQLWEPTRGVVVRREWFVVDEDLRYDLDGLRNQFSGTGLFVLLSLAAGLLLGALGAWVLSREELVAVAAVGLGAVLGSIVMWQVGSHLGPPDPDALARTATRGTVLADDLELGLPGALLAMPFTGLLGLCAVYLLVPARTRGTR